MKNRVALLCMALCLIFNSVAIAEDSVQSASLGSRWAKGTVQSKASVDLFSPIGGQINPFELEVGDTIDAGIPLLSVRPIEVRAAGDGVVRSLQAKVGDRAEDVIALYGALCYIDRPDVHLVEGTTSTAYDKADNRAISIGEPLRIYNGSESDPKESEGTVLSISPDGKTYELEIESGLFDLEKEVRLYRGTGDSYKSVDRVGKGTIAQAKPIRVLAEGVVANVQCEEGQSVRRGDVLFYLDAPDARHDDAATTVLSSGAGGMIEQIFVQPGQPVQKGQLMITVMPLDALELKVDVDELDIPHLKPGQILQVKIDALPDINYAATVEVVSPLPIPVLDATKYQATLSMRDVDSAILPGMHVTAYWD